MKKTAGVDLTQKIIDHLSSTANQKDDLDGLILALYHSEIKSLSNKILQNLSMLISKGIVTEIKNHNERRYYQLSKTFKGF